MHQDTLVNVRKACELLGVSKATLFRWESVGIMPKGIRLSPRKIVWKMEDLEQWLKDKKEPLAK